jgi:hypothetical protein
MMRAQDKYAASAGRRRHTSVIKRSTSNVLIHIKQDGDCGF